MTEPAESVDGQANRPDKVIKGTLSDSATVPISGESFTTLLNTEAVRIEHIVSSDTPDTAVQKQAHDEWVIVLEGSAALELEGEPVDLGAGDWVWIPAGSPHRVLRSERGTRWLAVHMNLR